MSNPRIAEYGKATQITSETRKNLCGHIQKHPYGYLTSKLKKLLEKKKFRYEDPDTQKIIKMTGGNALVIKYLWEALQGSVPAIEGIFDRIDGKLANTQIDQSQHTHYVIFRNPEAIKENANSIRPRAEVKDAELPAR